MSQRHGCRRDTVVERVVRYFHGGSSFIYSWSFFCAYSLSVLKRCVLKTLAFAFGLRLRSKTRCFKTRVLGRRLPNGKPQERLRFRALRGKTLAFKKRIAIVFCDLKTSLGARACVSVACVQKTRRCAFASLSPLSLQLSFFAYSLFRCLLDTLIPIISKQNSNFKQKKLKL